MDAMVTGRVAAEEKQRGNEILKKLGTTPSRLIADLYDYVIREEKLPDLTCSREKQPEIGLAAKAELYRAFVERTTLQMPEGFWDSGKTDKELLAEALEDKYGSLA